MLEETKVLLGALVFRVLNCFLVQTYFVPDEYWQSLEPAHQLVFGNGYLTWEWKTGLRSYLHPLSISFFYWILKILHLDYRFLVVLTPSLVQAVFSAIGDVFLFKLTRLLYGERIARWTLISWALSWFGFFSMTRTLANSLETVLLLIGLWFYPWPRYLIQQNRNGQSSTGTYLAIATTTVIVRPTAAIFWVPMCLWHLLRSPAKLKFIYEVIVSVVPVILLCVLIDRICYGRWVISLWNFLMFNVIQGGSAFFGSHPWHWYITQGVPAVLFTQSILVALGAYVARNRLFLYLSVWYILIHSFLAHKEFRFLLPTVPLLCIYAGIWLDYTNRFKRHEPHVEKDKKAILGLEGLPRSTRALLCLLFVSNVPLALYTGLIHQRGALDITKFIHNRTSSDSQLGPVWFLMPCHSTPYYSHIHTDVQLRFLTCEPNFSGSSEYVEEADEFHSSPTEWLSREFSVLGSKKSQLPSIVVMFDQMWSRLDSVLRSNGYRRCSLLFYTHFPQSQRQGRYITAACQSHK